MVKKKRPTSGRFWDNSEGWKPVEVGNEFLLGSEEYGFMGLEELDPSSALGVEILEALPKSDSPACEADQVQPRPNKKAKKNLRDDQKESNVIPETVDDLKARLAALEAENEALKRKSGTKEKSSTEKKSKKNTRTDNNGTNKAISVLPSSLHTQKRVDVSAWNDFQLDQRIMDSLSRLGFSAPTHIQSECLPASIRDRRDVIGAAQTGSGKTLAFGLPILHALAQEKNDDSSSTTTLRALILAPTRELAMQVCQHLQVIGKDCDVWVVPIVGGISSQKQERLLSKKPQVVVATPGRLWDLMREGHHHVANLHGLSFLVIDEADRMVQQGHYAELSSILDAIPVARQRYKDEDGMEDPDIIDDDDDVDKDDKDKKDSGEKQEGEDNDKKSRESKKKTTSGCSLQTFVFSATLTLPGDLRKRLRKGGGGASGSATLESLMDKVPFLGNGKPKIVDLTSERKVADKITEACISCPEAERDEYLYCLLAAHPGRTIVFVNAISAVRRLAAILKILGLPVQALHAGMQQRARLKALDRFRTDTNGILVATDVAARGLDIKDIRCVVHYQLPASLDVYVHRSGRTARADAEGLAIALVTPKEDARYRALLRALGRKEPPAFPLDASLMEACRRRVRVAVQLDSLERKESKERADKSWRRQHAEELGIELSDDSEDELVVGRKIGKKAKKEDDTRGGAPKDNRRRVEKLRGELAALLAEPLQPKFSRKFFTGGAAAGVALHQSNKNNNKDEKNENYQENTAKTVSMAVTMAQKVKDRKTSVVKKKLDGGTPAAKSNTKAKKMTRAQALAEALRKQQTRKMTKGGKKRGMFVVSEALGRVAEGPDALATLRARLQATLE